MIAIIIFHVKFQIKLTIQQLHTELPILKYCQQNRCLKINSIILPDVCKNSPYNSFPLYRRTDNSKASQISEPFTVTLPISF